MSTPVLQGPGGARSILHVQGLGSRGADPSWPQQVRRASERASQQAWYDGFRAHHVHAAVSCGLVPPLTCRSVLISFRFCGVNVIAYYSTEVFVQGGFTELSALSASLGFGVINWLFVSSLSTCIMQKSILNIPQGDPSDLHNRHIRSARPRLDNLPHACRHPPLHRIRLLDPGSSHAHRSDRSGHLPVRHRLQSGHGPCAFHIQRRGLSALRAHLRHESGNGDTLVLQLRALHHMAESVDRLQAAGCLWVVRGLERVRVVRRTDRRSRP